MAQSERGGPAATRERVELILRSAIESELSRAVTAVSPVAEGAPFSRGLIFSKTNPFSRGIFFSRNSGDENERPNELEQEVALNPAILGALAERLTQVRALKDIKGEFRHPNVVTTRVIERPRNE